MIKAIMKKNTTMRMKIQRVKLIFTNKKIKITIGRRLTIYLDL